MLHRTAVLAKKPADAKGAHFNAQAWILWNVLEKHKDTISYLSVLL